MNIDLRLLVGSVLDEKPLLIISRKDDLIHKLKRSDYTDFAHRLSVCCQMKLMTKAHTVVLTRDMFANELLVS